MLKRIFSVRFSRILLFCLLAVAQAGLTWKGPATPPKVSFSMDRDGNRYFFRASILVRAEPACLLETIYRFHHLRQLLKKDAAHATLLSEDTDHYDVRYIRQNKLYTLETTYRRSLQKDRNRVLFELIDSYQKGRVIPKLLSAKGYYELEAVAGGVRVHYFEETAIATSRWDPRTAGLLEVVERDTLSFLKRLKKYAEQTACRET
ncbi:MAG: hypothetical protein KTQ49_03100 [Candidatus Omnitrophica bacterium]|nr:hypothetical protein [Candidatus Omnitrophota bacterium]